jgi:hypothetical protein
MDSPPPVLCSLGEMEAVDEGKRYGVVLQYGTGSRSRRQPDTGSMSDAEGLAREGQYQRQRTWPHSNETLQGDARVVWRVRDEEDQTVSLPFHIPRANRLLRRFQYLLETREEESSFDA